MSRHEYSETTDMQPDSHRSRAFGGGSKSLAAAFVVGALSVALLGACGGAGDSPAGSETAPEKTVSGAEPFHGLLQYRGKDAKLALIRPSFLAAADAHLADGVSVVGVSIGGAHRAYPLYVLKNHQVVNDTLAEVPLAASW